MASSVNEFKRNHLDPGKFEEGRSCEDKSLTTSSYRKVRFRESEKIQKRIFLNSGLSLEPLNGSKIANPNFREEARGKWKGRVRFN